jgi:hypothetical protein
MNAQDTPLFPLSTVLFPGGYLGLRIFEPRYLSMVRDCTAHNRPFGVVLLLRGEHAGEPATAVATGTLATIVDFDALPDGLLGIRVLGGRRFHVDHAHARHDGLLLGRLSLWPEDPVEPLPPEYALLGTLAANLYESIVQGAPAPSKAQLDDSCWVGNRLAELLPFSLSERQQLLELTQPRERLQRIVDALPRFRAEPDEDAS